MCAVQNNMQINEKVLIILLSSLGYLQRTKYPIPLYNNIVYHMILTQRFPWSSIYRNDRYDLHIDHCIVLEKYIV